MLTQGDIIALSSSISKSTAQQLVSVGIQSVVFVSPNIFKFTLANNSVQNVTIANFNEFTLALKNKLISLDDVLLNKFTLQPITNKLLFDGQLIGGSAIDITLDTTNFNNNLDNTITNVQKLAEKVDDLVMNTSTTNPNITNYNLVGIGGVLQYTVGYISNADTIMTATSNNLTHFNKVVGLILETKNQGEPVNIQIGGEVINNTWSLVAGDSYYLGLGGSITNIAPSTGFIQKIGIAKNSTTLLISLGTPIKIL